MKKTKSALPFNEKRIIGKVAEKLRGMAKGAFNEKTDRQIREAMYNDRHGL